MIPIDNDTGWAIVQALKAIDTTLYCVGVLIFSGLIVNGCMQ